MAVKIPLFCRGAPCGRPHDGQAQDLPLQHIEFYQANAAHYEFLPCNHRLFAQGLLGTGVSLLMKSSLSRIFCSRQ